MKYFHSDLFACQVPLLVTVTHGCQYSLLPFYNLYDTQVESGQSSSNGGTETGPSVNSSMTTSANDLQGDFYTSFNLLKLNLKIVHDQEKRLSLLY